jgi:hypothetical protein
MAGKFFGNVGYGESLETATDVWEDVIVERPYYGDVLRNPRTLEDRSESVLPGIQANASISILADAYAFEHFFAMKYVSWMGSLWIVREIDASQRPRLILRLGGVYNGPTAPKP